MKKETEVSINAIVAAVSLSTLLFNAANANPDTFSTPKINHKNKLVRVAVIDTGIAESYKKQSFLCKTGHKDFTGTSIYDVNGHGTNISGLIDQNVKSIFLSSESDSASKLEDKKVEYCQIIIKFFHTPSDPKSTLSSMIQAIQWAILQDVDVINISAGGPDYDSTEASLIKEALDKGIVVVAAAGNDGRPLKDKNIKPYVKTTTFYPAQYDSRIIVVGNGSSEQKRSDSSNYGTQVDVWENGDHALSLGLLTTSILSGTSQSTAIFTGKFIKQQLSH